LGKPEGKVALEKPRCRWMLKGILMEQVERAWTGLFWLRVRRSDGLL
jgi:hypothetical protein